VRRGFRRYKIQERYSWEEAGIDGKVLMEFEDLEDCSPLSTGALHGRSQTVTIPDAVETQF
jgi:hypothetical protein